LLVIFSQRRDEEAKGRIFTREKQQEAAWGHRGLLKKVAAESSRQNLTKGGMGKKKLGGGVTKQHRSSSAGNGPLGGTFFSLKKWGGDETNPVKSRART